jgi:hypothetical protein
MQISYLCLRSLEKVNEELLSLVKIIFL